MNDNLIGNLTTIIKFLSLMIFPYCTSLGITQDQLIAIISLIIGFTFAYIDAKYPNTFKILENNEQTIKYMDCTTPKD